MCSERYADELPLGFWKYQLPPTSSDASKHVCGILQSPSDLTAVKPLTPAPITQVVGCSDTRRSVCPRADTLPEMSPGRTRSWRVGVTLLAALAAVAGVAAPAGATFKGRNGRIALAWLDNDQGAHFEAAYAIVTVPWLRGSSTGKSIVSCTS